MVGRSGPELVVGLVGAVGTSLSDTIPAIETSLARFGYTTTTVELSSLLALTPEGAMVDKSTEKRRLETSMQAGTALRKRVGRGDAFIALAALRMSIERRKRQPVATGRPKLTNNHCFILKSLKHEDEVKRLRDLYRDQFICIGVYSPRWRRLQDLSERLANSAGGRAADSRSDAERLIATDEKESGTRLGQSVREAYPLADAFVTVERLRSELDRVFDLLFGNPFLTPTRDEQGMFLAQAAALRSGALARQVGACITTQEGDVLAVGCNEAPRAGGGQYWAGDDPDGRDLAYGHDRNDRIKQRLARELLKQFKESDWLTEQWRAAPLEELVSVVLSKAEMSQEVGAKPPRFAETLVGSLTEFGRDVHAEMSALTTMARLGRPTLGATLYCTTFPCHNCAKHVIAAGIPRVVYVEPYPKSFALEFHSDAMVLEHGPSSMGTQSLFEPFSGVAPRKYLRWFQSGTRKNDSGEVTRWSPTEAYPGFAKRFGSYNQVDLDIEASFFETVGNLALKEEALANSIIRSDTEQTGGET